MHRLFRVLCLTVLFLTAPAYGAFEKNNKTLPTLQTMEHAVYEMEQKSPVQRMSIQGRSRMGDVITYTVDGKVVQTITQTPDGRETVITNPDGGLTSRIVLSVPLFSLPDSAMVQGKIYPPSAQPEGVQGEDIFVKVTRVGNLATYNYVQENMAEGRKDINLVKYRGSSRLPEYSEHWRLVGGVITYHVIFRRILAPQ